MKKARLSFLDAGDSMDARTRRVTVSKQKEGDHKIDPRAESFKPEYTKPGPYSDMLGAWTIYDAMYHALDSKAGEVKGIAFALPEDGKKEDLGFEFKVYRGGDTVGWYTARGGNETYTVLNIYVDIIPVKLTRPLYRTLKLSRP
jgi:cyanophycinase